MGVPVVVAHYLAQSALSLGGIVLGATGFSPLGWVGFAGLMLICK